MVIHIIQAVCLHKINGIPAFIFPQSENMSKTNGHMVATFCMSLYGVSNFFYFLDINVSSPNLRQYKNEKPLYILASLARNYARCARTAIHES